MKPTQRYEITASHPYTPEWPRHCCICYQPDVAEITVQGLVELGYTDIQVVKTSLVLTVDAR